MTDERRSGASADSPATGLAELLEDCVTACDAFRSLVERSPDPICIHRGRLIVHMNPAGVRTFRGESELDFLGRSILDLVHPDHRNRIEERLGDIERSGGVNELEEERFLALDGNVLVGAACSYVLAPGDPPYLVSLGRDLTEATRLAAQLRHAERLATIGAMVTGIAHELNNPLTYVLCNLVDLAHSLPEMAKSTPSTELLREFERRVEGARAGAERLREIARDLTRFGRLEEDAVGPVWPRRVVESALRMARPELKHAEVVERLGPVPEVRCNELRLTQVILNLLVNAGQALRDAPPDRPPRVEVVTSTDALGWAVIEVMDTGPGIAPEHRERLFEPFFTTKPHGTGIGLSVAKTIVTDLGGEIDVESEPGRGTLFRVRLPPIREDAR